MGLGESLMGRSMHALAPAANALRRRPAAPTLSAMVDFDAFNGDADGICALIQLRLSEPRESILVTGVKRDITLLERVQAAEGDRVTVLDVSLDANRSGLEQLLSLGAELLYIDHHFAGEIPTSERLETHIAPAPETCTSLIVSGLLRGAYADWAVVGAFGDNLHGPASKLAGELGWSEERRAAAEELGRLFNYNSYGGTPEDLHFRPEELYRRCARHASPFEMLAAEPELRDRLAAGYAEDLARAQAIPVASQSERSAVFVLPGEPWARRVSGELGNLLAREHPARAHAVLTGRGDGGYVVSVRAPLENRTGADELCRGFATGGGRPAAAGIQRLPEEDVDRFTAALAEHYA